MDEASGHAPMIALFTVYGCVRSRPSGLPADAQGDDDDWQEPGMAHKVLDLPWARLTTFRTRDVVWAEEEVEGRDSTVPPLGLLLVGELV